jgi:glycosyltransferase involved in cell wall biosynthesis
MHGNEEEYLLTAVIPYLPSIEIEPNLQNLVSKAINLPIKIVICVDTDCESDASELVKQFPVSNNIEITHGYSRSPGLTRNLGIDLVRTPYFTFWDADDQINPREIESLINSISIARPSLAVSRFAINNSKHKIQKWSKWKILNSVLLGANPGLWRWTFETSTFKGIRFSSLSLGEDLEYLCNVFSLGKSITYFNQVTYMYKKPNSNVESQSIRGIGSMNILLSKLFSTYRDSKSNYLLIASIVAKQFLAKKLKYKVRSKKSRNEPTNKDLSAIGIHKLALFLIMIILHIGLKIYGILSSLLMSE